MNRKGFKGYLIQGYKEGIKYAHRLPKITLGVSFALFMLAWILSPVTAPIVQGVATVANAIGVVEFDTAGLTGENLALYQDLQKRIKKIPGTYGEAELKQQLETRVKEALKMFEGLDDAKITQLKEFLGSDDKGIRSILIKQGEEITKLKQNLDNKEQRLDIRSQVAEWQTANKAQLEKVISKQSKDVPSFELRAANSPMTPANTISDTVTLNAADVLRVYGGGAFPLRRIQPTFWSMLAKGRTNLVSYPWVNYKVPADSGAANFIGPGVAKPNVSFTLEVEQSAPKKVAVSLKTSTELLQDVEGMTSFIQGELAYQHDKKCNTTMMTGVLSSTSPAGVQTFSVGYTLSGIEVFNPNYQDCIRAVVAQLRTNFIDSPITVFINPVDAANMEMQKTLVEGQYLLAPFASADGRNIAGAVIVEDNNITAGYFQAIAMDALKVLMYKDFTISFGWENDDFTKNLVTVVGESRFHTFHSDNDAQAFVYDDFADVQSQIAAA
jgi:hypothetical protein